MVINLDTIISQNKNIDVSDFNGEKVMMNINKGMYFMLNDVGSIIWDQIDEKKKIKEVVENLMKIYDVDRNECETSVLEYIKKLEEADIIEII